MQGYIEYAAMRGLLRAVCHRQYQPAVALEPPRVIEVVGDSSLSQDHRQWLGFKQPVQPKIKQ